MFFVMPNVTESAARSLNNIYKQIIVLLSASVKRIFVSCVRNFEASMLLNGKCFIIDKNKNKNTFLPDNQS